MTTQMNKMDTIANNMANVDTTGYKKDTAVTSAFSELMMKRVNDPEYTFLNIPKDIGGVTLGVFVQHIGTDFQNGALKRTDGDLDFGLSGEGFFAVNYVNGDGELEESYTRDGSFTLSGDGALLTKDGYGVLGENGPIINLNGIVTVDETGNIYADGAFVDRLKLVDFENKNTLMKIENNLYLPKEGSEQQEATASIVQGFLESSNVNPVNEMVDMISTSRLYEANQKVITIHDQTLGRAVNDIARK
jgi:flagellar basal-body rod protein FlgG